MLMIKSHKISVILYLFQTSIFIGPYDLLLPLLSGLETLFLLYHLLSRSAITDPKSDLIDFTLSNARRFYSSKGDPLGVKG